MAAETGAAWREVDPEQEIAGFRAQWSGRVAVLGYANASSGSPAPSEPDA